MVAGRRSQIAFRCRIVDQLDLAEQAIFQIGGDFLGPDVVEEKTPATSRPGRRRSRPNSII
jgi:hypothetical protein